MYLQNVYSSENVTEQGLSLALCLTQGILGNAGAYRVHGGGFGGTIQAFVPSQKLNEYQNTMDSVFGKDACKVLRFRPQGGVMVSD
jgi:galactokinase